MAAAVVAVSCAKIDVAPAPYGAMSDEPMSFSSYASKPVSRADADVVTGTVLPDSTSFGVFAYYQQGVVGSSTAHWSDGGWTPAFMFNQEVEFDGSEYSYSPVRYWPANSENTISFWAYYPYGAYNPSNTGDLRFYESDGTTSFSKTSTGLPLVKYTVPSDPEDQYDLLFDSFASQDMTYESCATPGTVPFTFRHALCLVDLMIVEGTGAVINSLSFGDIYWSATCANPVTRTWSSHTDAGSFSLSSVTISGNKICSFLVIPQTISASAELSINYDISFESSDPSHPEPIVYRGNIGSALLRSAGVNEWTAGQHYVYKIRAGFERIEFEEVVEAGEDWSIGNDNISVPEQQ